MSARLVKDINPAGSSSPNELISLNGLLFFTAELSTEPATSNNGNSDESTGTNSDASTPGPTDDSATIEGTRPNSSIGLIRSDGSEKSTTVLHSFSSVTNLVSTGDQLFFIAGVNNQYQLWTSDGTVRGTKQAKDLYPNADSNFPQDLFEIDGVLFYSAIDGTEEDGKYPYVNGYEVWRREGNGVGSRFFRNLIPDKIITDIQISDGDSGSLILDSSGQPVQLKKTTTVETTIEAGSTTTKTTVDEEKFINRKVVNTTTSNSKTNATVGTDTKSKTVSEEIVLASEIANTAEITTTVFENDSFPRDFVGINGNYFFTAQSSSFYSLETSTSDTLIGGLELWFSDGTEAGTRPININQNTYTFYKPEDGEYTPAEQLSKPEFGFYEQSSSSFPRQLTPSRNNLFFVANDGIAGFELWSITDQGTKPSLISDLNPGTRSSSPEELTVVGKNLYFSADQGSGRKLFYYNKSLKKPKLVKNSGDNPELLTAVGKHLYYSAESELGRELWSAKKLNSKMVKDINLGSESSSPSDMTMVTRIIKNKLKKRKTKYLYFTADDGFHGTEIMSVNLKTKRNKVSISADIIDGPSSSFPRELTNHNQKLFFTATDSSNGRELWTVGPAIKGPSGESGASSSNINVFENKNFVYQFKTDNEGDNETYWKINGGKDASFFKINSGTGKLEFKSKQEYRNPEDYNSDNIYEVFVRSIDTDSGYKSDQLINVTISDSNSSNSEVNVTSDEIFYYTEKCGPITANGPLYPCEQDNSDRINGASSSGSGSSGSLVVLALAAPTPSLPSPEAI